MARSTQKGTKGRASKLLCQGVETSAGPHTTRLFERILADKPHPEMGYRSCLGIIRLADKYSPARVEAAAERRRDFWEICEDCYQVRSTILTSQLPVSRRHGAQQFSVKNTSCDL